MEVLLGVIAAIAVVGLVAIASYALWLARSDRPAPPHPPDRVAAPAPRKRSLVPAQSILLPDYVDENLLNEVAEQLGVNVEIVGLTLGSAVRQSSAQTTAVQAGVDLGPVHAGEERADTDAEEREKSATVSYQSRPNFRAKIRAVLDELGGRDELVLDLKEVPEDVIPEATFLQAGLVITFEWDLVGVEPGTGTDDDPRPEVVRSLDEVEEFAKDQIQKAVVARFRKLGKDQRGQFALVTSRWHVHEEGGGPALGVSTLDTGPLVPSAFPDLDDIPAPSHEIWVPLTATNLSSHGSHRLVPNHFVDATVFGRIDSFDAERGALVLLPIAIYSVQDPTSAASTEAL